MGWSCYSWGYYRVVNGDQDEIVQGSLNFAGQAALTITANGTYTMTIYPGKSKGVVKTVTFTVNNGVITSSDFTITNRSTTIDLPRGNVEGLTRYSDGSIAKEVLIAASRSDDATIVAKTASSETGKYFLNLDRTYTWNIKFFDPQTSQVGQLTLTPATTNFNLDFPAVAAA